jgi:hypothetical protein
MYPNPNACSPVSSQLGAGREPVVGSADPVDDGQVRGPVGANRRDGLLPNIHLLVELHGQRGRVAALTPLSADGVIVVASTTLPADSMAGERGG